MMIRAKQTLMVAAILGLSGMAIDGAAQLASPSTYTEDTTREIGFGVQPPPIDANKRDQVVRLHRYYGWGFRWETSTAMEQSISAPFGSWFNSADVSNCVQGSTRDDYRHGFVREINFARALAGMPSIKVEVDADLVSTAQAGAVALAANSDVRPFGGHFLPNDSRCFSQKAANGVTNGTGFGTSHTITYLARPYSLSTVFGFLSDAGAGNYWVGHRQAMLDPSTTAVGLAIARNASTQAVGQNHTLRAGGTSSKDWYAFPTPGYFPYRYLPDGSNRWSFSCAGCDFTGTTVEMKRNGQALPAPTYEAVLPVAAFYRTFVWKPSGVTYYLSGRNGLGGVQGNEADFNDVYTTPTQDDVYEVTVRNYRQFNSATGQMETKSKTYQVIAMDPARADGAVVPAYEYTDMWWDPAENGHGLQLFQSIQYESALLFGLWYRYDSTGTGRWVQLSSGQWTDPFTFTGLVYEATSAPALNYSATAFDQRVIGTFTLRFQGKDRAQLVYNTNADGTIVKNFERFRGLPKVLTDGRNYSGLYWNPSENGWGLAVTQYYQNMFVGWYTYDSAGKTSWVILPGPTWVSANQVKGTLYRGTGSANMVTYSSAAHQTQAVGEATLTFLGDGRVQFDYTLDGVTQAKTIQPLGY